MNALDALGRWKPGRTFAQTLAALLGADGLGLVDVDWPSALSVSGMAGLLSALTIWAQGQAWLAEPRQAGAHES
jgi:hypothetical protein